LKYQINYSLDTTHFPIIAAYISSNSTQEKRYYMILKLEYYHISINAV